jgi:hypothetical protein
MAPSYETADGQVRVIDCMPMRSEEPNVVRLVEGQRGRVPMSPTVGTCDQRLQS